MNFNDIFPFAKNYLTNCRFFLYSDSSRHTHIDNLPRGNYSEK